MQWLMENQELVLGLVAAVLAVLAKMGLSWALALRKALSFLCEKMEQDPMGAAKALSRTDTPTQPALVQMAIQTAAALADPKPDKKPQKIVKRALANLAGNWIAGMLSKRR